MAVHLYCILPRGARGALPARTGPRGLDGARVRGVVVGGLVAWVSDVKGGIPITVDGVKAHDAVVEAALNTGTTPVPARFGQRFANDDACREALERRAEPVAALLATMQGFVEMTLLVTPSTRRMLRDLEPLPPELFEHSTVGVGRRYLESRRRRAVATGDVRDAATPLAGRASPD